MVLAFSFCHSDKQQAVRLAHWIRRLGGVEQHSCLIAFPSTTDAAGIEEPLREAFRYVETLTYSPQLSGWPAGANEQHARVAQHLAAHQRLTGPWLFMEADCAVVGSHWLDMLAGVHLRSGKPMLGTLNNTVETLTNRVVGRHTVGVAVYPQDFARVCPLVRNMIRTSSEYVRGGQLPPAFDCYYEAYTVGMTHVTPLIQHLWRTDSYREEGGQIACNFRTPYGVPGLVSPEAVLIHGCKDGSLMDILEARAGAAPVIQARVPVVNPAYATATHESGPSGFPMPRQSSAGGHGAQGEPATGSVSLPFETPPSEPVHAITEAEMDADPNAPVMPPFPKGSPEDIRHRELLRMKWPQFQKYAAHKLKLKAFGVPRVDLVNQAVLKEREAGVEPWVKTIPVRQSAPVVPIQPVREWSKGDGTAVPMSDIQYKRMMALRAQREAVGA